MLAQWEQAVRQVVHRGECPVADRPILNSLVINLRMLLLDVQRAEQLATERGLESPAARESRLQALDKAAQDLPRFTREVSALLAHSREAIHRFQARQTTGAAAPGATPIDSLLVACDGVKTHAVDLLERRKEFLRASERNHPFYKPRMLQSKALYWEAARLTVEDLWGGKSLQAHQVRSLPSSPASPASPGPARPAGQPSDTHFSGDGDGEGKHATRIKGQRPSMQDAGYGVGAAGTPASQASTLSPSRFSSSPSSGISPGSSHSASPGASPSASLGSPASSVGMSSPSPASAAPAARVARPRRPELAAAGSAAAAKLAAKGEKLTRRERVDNLFHGVCRRFDARAQALVDEASRLANADTDGASRLADPGDVLGLGRKPGKKGVETETGEKRKPLEDAVQKTFEGDFGGDARLPEREFAWACVKETARRAWAQVPELALKTEAELKAAFDAHFSRLLAERPNGVIRSQVLLPVEGDEVQALGRRVRQQLTATCEQRPAIAVTSSLEQAYEAEGLQGAHCHQRTQHLHCPNLYLSRFSVAQEGGRPLLSLARHAVLSPMALRETGLESISNDDLGRVALDLAPALALKPLPGGRAQPQFHEKVFNDAVIQLQAWAQAAKAPDLSEEAKAQLRSKAAQWVRDDVQNLSLRKDWNSSFYVPAIFQPRRTLLIDALRAAGALNRAREAAQVAMASLPEETLLAMAHKAHQGEVPTVRLASVSLMSPDPGRHLASSHASDELAMWRDQRDAWAALAKSAQPMPVPVLDASGQLLRDAQGRLVFTETTAQGSPARVKFEVVALNVPVNEAGTSGLPTGAFAATKEANRRAMESLLGNRRQMGLWRDWVADPNKIGGWVGEEIRRNPGSARARTLAQLAFETADIYLNNKHHTAGADPYKLAKRLIVLTSMLSNTATLANCKSGKDRTSEAETQARHLALEIALRQGTPPKAKEAMTPLRQAQLGALHEAGGSHEIQWWNTNMAGTKLSGRSLMAMYGLRGKSFFLPKWLYKRVARPDPAVAAYQGTSKLTDS